jgi:hypothetical protein
MTYCGMLRPVVSLKVTDFSEVLTATIIRSMSERSISTRVHDLTFQSTAIFMLLVFPRFSLKFPVSKLGPTAHRPEVFHYFP